ncbi:unnamed protein product [Cuscuta epithymum]|uniref:RNase H type-1 domain-containing protein n=1 Tax=Cuscuta epithymum TaxID=186058 RepID=A0AAV0G0A5_9ASTE|nr:unnamed protein product [Cuscuta epithymum]
MESSPTSSQIIVQIKIHTQAWSASLSKLKIRTIGDVLFEEQIIHKYFKLAGTSIRLIRWLKPQSNFKLNADARYISGKAGGGAILRNQDGEMLAAISFPITASTSLEAEIIAIIIATRWAVESGYCDFQVETDATQVVSYFVQVAEGRWKTLFQEMKDYINRKGVSIGHALRESNWVAHHMSAAASAQLQIFNRPQDLPYLARQAYFRDLYGLPSFRCSY